MKIHKTFIMWLFIATYASCQPLLIPFSELKYDNLYYMRQGQTFTGEAYIFFENENRVSFQAKFKNGVPSGAWQSFGYQGEVVQHGFHYPKIVKKFEITLSEKPLKIDRINYNEFYEEPYSILYIILISKEVEEEKTIDDQKNQAIINSKIPRHIQINKFSEIKYLITNKEI